MAMRRHSEGTQIGVFGASGLQKGQRVGGRSYGYGEVDESDYVHPEIEAEGRKLRQAVKESRGRHQSEEGMLDALAQHGAAPGGQRMMNAEMAAAVWSMSSGLYVTFRSSNKQDCCRIGPDTPCFCGCPLSHHDTSHGMARCGQCKCPAFSYIPIRPEEAGMGHLMRRKEFDIRTWSAPCKCKHGAASHGPVKQRCRDCSCFHYESNWACVVCDKRWEDHTTELEDASTRDALRLPTGEAYKPLAGVNPEFSNLVFGKKNAEGVHMLPLHNAHQRAIKPKAGAKIARVAPSASSSSSQRDTVRRVEMKQHCTGCAQAYPSPNAKFCTNCGERR